MEGSFETSPATRVSLSPLLQVLLPSMRAAWTQIIHSIALGCSFPWEKYPRRLWFAPTASLAPGLSQPLLLRRTCETPCFFIFKRQHA